MNIAALPFFQRINWRPDRRELRRFAVAMLVGFSLLGLLAVWRAKDISNGAIVLWGIGILLAIAAFVHKLSRVAYLSVYLHTRIVGYVLHTVILALMFFLVITPVGVLLRLMGKDFLQRRRPKHKAGWVRVNGVKTEDNYYRQF